MKRILINATHSEEVRVALCKDNHMYDFDLENRTREQKKANIYKAHVTRVEPSLEAVFVEYGSKRQGFLPIREIAKEYLSGNRSDNIRELIKEGDSLIVQIEKEERGNKGAALSTFISLAGRFLVLMPNNARGGGISRQISGKMREDMKRIVASLDMPQGMSVIIRTAGIGKTQEDLQHDLDHLLNIWAAIGEQNRKHPSPRLMHQEAGVVTRAVRDYLRDDISEVWIDDEEAYNEAANFITAVMPKQLDKLRKYTDFEPMLARFGIEKQIETAYLREVKLPSGGSIVIDQTEAMVAIDINSAKSKKGADVSGTAYHTNLEAAEEIARQLRLRDMGGLVVIDFIDMQENEHQKEVEKRLIDATKYDRARVQFSTISKFGLMEMSRQRLRPSLEESTGFKCPRCNGNGMIRDLRSLGLSIMRQIEQMALSKRQGEVQAEVPTDIAAFLLNEKRESLVYLEQDSGTRITVLPHSHMESPDFALHYNPEGFAPSSYERITDTEEQESSDRGYDVNWQTADNEKPKHQPTRQPRHKKGQHKAQDNKSAHAKTHTKSSNQAPHAQVKNNQPTQQQAPAQTTQPVAQQPFVQQETQAMAWLSNLFAPTPEAKLSDHISATDAAQAIETIVNQGGQSLGALGQVNNAALQQTHVQPTQNAAITPEQTTASNDDSEAAERENQRKTRKPKYDKGRYKKDRRHHKNKPRTQHNQNDTETEKNVVEKERREPHSKRESRGEFPRKETLAMTADVSSADSKDVKVQADNNAQSTDKSVEEQPRHNKAQHHNNRKQHKSGNKNQQRRAHADDKPSSAQKDAHKQQSQQPEAQAVVENLADNKPAERSKNNRKQGHKKRSETQNTDNGSTNANVTEVIETTEKNQPEGIQSKDVANTSVAPVTTKIANDDATQAKTVSETPEVAESSELTSNVEATKQNPVLQKAIAEVVANSGRSLNDPRVVIAALKNEFIAQHRLEPTATEAQPIVEQTVPVIDSIVKITGTVGTFIRSMLENAEERLTQEGVIACFLEAVDTAKLRQQAEQQVVSDTSVVGAIDTSHLNDFDITSFDFSNYGYGRLTTDYLRQFSQMTNVAGKFNAVQGKTEVEATPIGLRATNDPRGQVLSVEEVEALTATASITEEHVDETVTHESEIVETETVEAEVIAPTVTGEAGTELSDAVESVNKIKVDEIATESYRNEDTSEEVTEETSVENSVEDESDSSQDDLSQNNDKSDFDDNNQNTDSDTDENSAVENTESTEADAKKGKDSSGKERSKTSFDKYKSMLANVSEQMLGSSTGTPLVLSSQPVPKMRTRKVKKND